MPDAASTTSVVVIDDHPFFRDGITRQLSLSAEIAVVGSASTGEEGFALIREAEPDVAVVDYQLPGMSGVDLVARIACEKLRTIVLIVSAHCEGELVFQAIAEGAGGYISKEATRDEVVQAVRSVATGHTVLPPELADGLADQIRFVGRTRGPLLSERERDVLEAFARGLSIPQLASELFLSPSTVKSHAQHLYEKLGVSDRAAAVAEGLRRRLIE